MSLDVGEYEVTYPGQYKCKFCDQRCRGVIKVELYGGSLMVCESCYYLLRRKRANPYSKVITKFAVRACGYPINVKMARVATSWGKRWYRYG